MPNQDFDKDFFLDEVIAYRRLRELGFCAEGAVPKFYGLVPDMKPEDWPDWQIYHREGDEYRKPGDGILMEYVEGVQDTTMDNYNPERIAKLNRLLDRFHAAELTHGDVHPRNMMFVPGEDGKDERVLWLDFEGGFVGNVERLEEGSWEKRNRAMEKRLMDEFQRNMIIDMTKNGGEAVRTRSWWN